MGKRKTVQQWEGKRTDAGAKIAKAIRLELERLSEAKLIFKPIDPRVEGGYDPNFYGLPDDLDYHVLNIEGKHIATLEVTSNNTRTFINSNFIPINKYKGDIIKDLQIPVFVVLDLLKEKPLPLENRCIWIKGENVIKKDIQVRLLDTEETGKPELNYCTDTEDWTRGLQRLIDELKGLTL